MINLVKRPRRIRNIKAVRELVKETHLNVNDLIYPLFVVNGYNVKEEISSMPGVYHFSLDILKGEIEEIKDLGIKSILLFGLPEHKDECGSSAYDDSNIVQKAIKVVKEIAPDMCVITDVCLCQYTSHGHCGLINENGKVLNDESVELLAKTALSHIKAGADMVAPSDMMDGRIKGIRELLDKEGYYDSPIMSYSAKFSSAFYGPFREAADSAPAFGDRKSYQMDYCNSSEAMREIELDIEEGADIIMVKPALAYLDILRRAKDKFNLPVAAYNVSGEYSMVKAAAKMGWIDEKQVVLEILTGIKRAGADIIITYFAKEVAEWIREGSV